MAKGKKTTQTGEGGGTHGDLNLNIRVITPPGSIRVDQLRNCPVLVGVVIDLSQHCTSIIKLYNESRVNQNDHSPSSVPSSQ